MLNTNTSTFACTHAHTHTYTVLIALLAASLMSSRGGVTLLRRTFDSATDCSNLRSFFGTNFFVYFLNE